MPGLPRFQLFSNALQGNVFRITGDDHHHLVHVLRIGEGDSILLFNDTGEYVGIVDRVDREKVEGHLEGATGRCTESVFHVTLLQGLGRSEKMDLVVQKTTELGVSTIIPVVTAHSRSVPLPPDFTSRVSRWRKIAGEAAKQTGRTCIPDVTYPRPLEAALKELDEGGIFFWEKDADSFRKVAQTMKPAGRINLLVGPEGGFTETEAQLITGHGFVPVSLGPRILRTETAGIIAVALAAYEFGDMG